jgi:hypothetical protein
VRLNYGFFFLLFVHFISGIKKLSSIWVRTVALIDVFQSIGRHVCWYPFSLAFADSFLCLFLDYGVYHNLTVHWLNLSKLKKSCPWWCLSYFRLEKNDVFLVYLSTCLLWTNSLWYPSTDRRCLEICSIYVFSLAWWSWCSNLHFIYLKEQCHLQIL